MTKRARNLNLPNLITGGRFVLAALLLLLLLQPQTPAIGITALIVFIAAAASDGLDGYLARRYQEITVLGKLMDPLADKVLVATALVMLIPLGRIAPWLALLILVREFFVTGLRGVAASSGIVVAASLLGKLKANTQYIGLGFLIFPLKHWGFLPVHAIGEVIMYAALFLTIWSGFDYFYQLRRIFLEEKS